MLASANRSPHRERGLKHYAVVVDLDVCNRSPHRERGLKRGGARYIAIAASIAPLTGSAD